VDAVVTAAVAATAVASTKAARRRVRQRMVKKLAPMIRKDDLQELVDYFKMPRSDQPAPAQVGEQPSVKQLVQAAATLPMPMQFVCVQIAIPMVIAAPRVGDQLVAVSAVQDIRQLLEKPQVQCIDATAKLDFTGESASSLLEGSIPVARTFVHFDTCEGTSRRRSRSV